MFWERWTRRGRRRLARRELRGYRELRRSERLDLLSRIRNELTDAPIVSARGGIAEVLFGRAASVAEIAIRQFLLLRVISSDKLNRALLVTLGDSTVPVIHPLPSEWREVLRRHGFNLPRIRSAIVWQ